MQNSSQTRDRRWLGLFAVLAAMILNILDSTIVNVAAPSIRADLGGPYATLQWYAAAYTLALAVGLLTGGRLGDLFGRRRMLLTGVTGFVLASLACAFATSPGMLIGSRAVQGLCGAMLVPQCFGLIRDLFPPQQIGKAFGALGPVIGLSTIAGPIVAGLLVDADLAGTGWRAVFLLNAPVGLFVLLAGRVALPAGSRVPGVRLDLLGALLAGVGSCAVVYPLVQGREQGWPPRLFALLGFGVLVLAGFVAYQLRRSRAGRTPLVELAVFARRSYAAGVGFVMVFFGSIVGFSLSIGLFLQLGLHYSPVRASLTMAAWAIGAFLGSGFAAATMAKLGRRIIHIGLTLMVLGLAAGYLVLDGGAAGIGWRLAGPLLGYGIGMGMIFVPLFDIIVGDLRDHEVGSASGMLESLQQLGSTLGVAVLGTVFFGAVGAAPVLRDFVGASRQVALLALGLDVLAFGLAFLLPRRARMHAPAPLDSAECAPASPAGSAPGGAAGSPADQQAARVAGADSPAGSPAGVRAGESAAALV